jgi:hypothetical protein
MNDKTLIGTEELPQIGTIYQHKNGEKYKVILITNLFASPYRRDEYPITIIYRNIGDETIWSRPLYRWKGNFTEIL